MFLKRAECCHRHDLARCLRQRSGRNAALGDGNERLGWLAVVVFYGLNDVDLDAPDAAYELVMSVARRELSVEEIAATLARWP